MNIIDIAIVLIILGFGLLGAKRGIFKQLVTTIGFILVIIIAYYLKNPLAEILSLKLPFFNNSSLNILLYQAISFIIVVILLELLLSFFIRLSGFVEKILDATIILGIPSKILGFIAGVIEGVAILFIVLFFLNQPSLKIDVVNDSKLSNKILTKTPILSNISKNMVDTINDIHELAKDSSKLDENTLNLKNIDVMLDHKLIDTDYVKKIIDNHKLDISGIDSVLDKYK